DAFPGVVGGDHVGRAAVARIEVIRRAEHGVDDTPAVENDEVADAALLLTVVLVHQIGQAAEGARRRGFAELRDDLIRGHAGVDRAGTLLSVQRHREHHSRQGNEHAHKCTPQTETRARTDSNNARPSLEPRSGSTARSGCGIIPRTFPASLTMPAMARVEPLGLHHSSVSAAPARYRNTTRPSPSSLSIVSSSAV